MNNAFARPACHTATLAILPILTSPSKIRIVGACYCQQRASLGSRFSTGCCWISSHIPSRSLSMRVRYFVVSYKEQISHHETHNHRKKEFHGETHGDEHQDIAQQRLESVDQCQEQVLTPTMIAKYWKGATAHEQTARGGQTLQKNGQQKGKQHGTLELGFVFETPRLDKVTEALRRWLGQEQSPSKTVHEHGHVHSLTELLLLLLLLRHFCKSVVVACQNILHGAGGG